MTTSREFKELGNQTSTGILLVRESLLVPPGGIPAGSTTVTADPATIVGDGGATPLGVVGAGAQAGQFQTNANGVRIRTKQGAAGNAEIYTFAGDPNGVFAADKGSLVLDITNAKLWRNSSGGTVYAEVGAGSGGNVISQQILVGVGVYVPTPGTTKVLLQMTGGGGGGGGAGDGALGTAAGGGGSSGVYLRKWLDPAALITGGAYIVGAAGAAGTAGGSVGGPGGDSSVIIQGVTYLAKGGTGGNGTGVSNGLNNVYGVTTAAGSTAADVNATGSGGGGIFGGGLLLAGVGGSNPLGGGGGGGTGVAAGNPGTGFGGGGGGGQTAAGSGGRAAGAGAIGGIIVTEFQ